MKKTTKQTQPQTSVITLRSNGSTLTLLATKKAEGAVTTVTTRDAEKKALRGMTEQHASMEVAKGHIAKLAEQAVKLGWARRRETVAKPDAFSTLPKAPRPSAGEAR